MSGKSDLVVIGSSSSSSALKLWQSYSSVSSVLLLVFAHCMQLCCLSQQSPNLCSSPASMRLRPRRYMGFPTFAQNLNTQDLFWSRVFWGFSYKAIYSPFTLFERDFDIRFPLRTAPKTLSKIHSSLF